MGGTHTPEPPAWVATGVVSVVFVTVCKEHLFSDGVPPHASLRCQQILSTSAWRH
jgi:hypothetical protein